MKASLESLLNRPADQRLREYKYRCAQSIVFGLPVVLLQYFGQRLGGLESDRWVAVLQALLAGWVMYVGAAGMLFEGVLKLRHGIGADFVVASLAILLYLISLISVLMLPIRGKIGFKPLLFHLSVTMIALWTACRWARLSRRGGSA